MSKHISTSNHILYLIVLAIKFTAARSVCNTLASTQNITGIAHAAFRTGPTAGWRFSRTSLLTGVCAGLVVAVRRARDS